MFRFTIRDILWLTFVVGFCLHAWTDRNARERERYLAQQRAKEAEKWANNADRRVSRYAKVMRQLQIDAIMARYAARSAETEAQEWRAANECLHWEIEQIENERPQHGLALDWLSRLWPAPQREQPPNP